MRKALILGVAACGMLFVTPAVAEECKDAVQLINRNQANPGPSAANMANPMLLCPSEADKNADGLISRIEWQEAVMDWHTELDEDKDGHLSTDEINRLQPGNQ
ncbi:MAG: hypothetical protein Kilf2KO_01930 [Rhodospirillales bacterium]